MQHLGTPHRIPPQLRGWRWKSMISEDENPGRSCWRSASASTQSIPSCFDRTGRDQSHPGFHLRLTSESVERKGETKKQRDILASEEVQRDIASPRHYDLWSLCTGPKGPCRWHLEKNAKSIGVDHRITLLCAEQLLNTGKIWQISAMIHIWLVVSTILKNMRQWEGLSRVLWNIKTVWNHQPDIDPLAATVRATCCHVPRYSRQGTWSSAWSSAVIWLERTTSLGSLVNYQPPWNCRSQLIFIAFLQETLCLPVEIMLKSFLQGEALSYNLVNFGWWGILMVIITV